MTMNTHFRRCATALSLILLLGACKPASVPVVGQALDSLNGHQEEREARLSTAAANAAAAGKTDEAMDSYARLYDDNKGDKDIALNYAQLLRRTGHADRALRVLAPFADKDNPVILNEYAAANIEIGRTDVAQRALADVIGNPKAANVQADAADLMGVALDAEGKHAEAEKMLRIALAGWKGDKTTVMNNLAICLAAQARFDESLLLLNRALVLAPGRTEIARNIDLVQSLRDNVLAKAPTPAKTK